jgi:hypothetical protein
MQISALIKNQRETFYPLFAISLVVIFTLIAQIPLIWKVHIAEYDEAIFLDVAGNIRQGGLPLRSIGERGAFYFEHTPLYAYFLRYIPGGLLPLELWCLKLAVCFLSTILSMGPGGSVLYF